MAVTTLALAFDFVSGFYVFLAGGGAEILMVVPARALAIVFLIGLGSHMYVGRSSIIDDYVHDGIAVAFLKFCATLRILLALYSNYCAVFGAAF